LPLFSLIRLILLLKNPTFDNPPPTIG